MMSPLSRIARTSTLVGVLAFGLCVIRFPQAPAAIFRSYLPACLFWTGIPVGSMALLMIHSLTGGAWGKQIRPALLSASATVPLNIILFLPLGAGLADIYPWMAPGPALAEAMAKKPAYLTAAAFGVREAVVFMSWLGLAAVLRVWQIDAHADERPSRSPGAGGLILYGLTMTAFGIDWIMSLEPLWSSANFGFLMMVSPMVSALAFATLAVCLQPQGNEEPVSREAAALCLNDLGNLLLAGVLLWGYLEFQQYLAIWWENLPDKIAWYLHRNSDGWEWLTAAMSLCYVGLPFSLLLARPIKRSRKGMQAVAALVLLGNLLNAYWLTLPAHYSGPPEKLWPGVLSFLATGGLWLGTFVWLLGRRGGGNSHA